MYKSLSLKLVWSQFSGKMWIIALTETKCYVTVRPWKIWKFFGKMTAKWLFEWLRVCQAGDDGGVAILWGEGYDGNTTQMRKLYLTLESSDLQLEAFIMRPQEWTLIIFLVGYLLSWDFTVTISRNISLEGEWWILSRSYFFKTL